LYEVERPLSINLKGGYTGKKYNDIQKKKSDCGKIFAMVYIWERMSLSKTSNQPF